ncbi:MAG: autotransporter-associated beta strand repeat-containing protein, partial [Phycisphaeraceae bacterium]|nr:autotransporter-associated beta strand repeat-containing protein [Phycisphaeraceae bacterium]
MMLQRRMPFICGLGFVLIGTSSLQVFGAAATWNSSSPGNWNSTSNWSPSTVPNGAGDSASFTSNITANTVITLDTDVTLGSLLMRDDAFVNSEGSHQWQITDSTNTYKLTFDNSGSDATISADKGGAGPHLISVPIVLEDNVVISGLGRGTSNSVQLNLSGNITSGIGKTTGLTINAAVGRAVRLSGSNSYTGTTVINTGGILYLSNADANIPTAGLSMNNGSLSINPSANLSRDITLTGTANRFTPANFGGTATLSGDITGTGGLTVANIGGAANTTIILSGSNDYQGGTIINNGTGKITLGAAGALPDTGTVTVYGNTSAGNTLNLNNISETIGALASARTGVGIPASLAKVTLGTATLTTGDATDTTFEGVISGTGGKLVKQGTGSFTLTNDNTYTGGTTVNNGKL